MTEFEAKLLLPALVDKAGHNHVSSLVWQRAPARMHQQQQHAHAYSVLRMANCCTFACIGPVCVHVARDVLGVRQCMAGSVHDRARLSPRSNVRPPHADAQDKLKAEHRELLRRAALVHSPVKIMAFVKVMACCPWHV
jgi:hypothetical protein